MFGILVKVSLFDVKYELVKVRRSRIILLRYSLQISFTVVYMRI